MTIPWNHDPRQYPQVLGVVPKRCIKALGVGCGERYLTRLLSTRSQFVVGLDQSCDMVARASEVNA